MNECWVNNFSSGQDYPACAIPWERLEKMFGNDNIYDMLLHAGIHYRSFISFRQMLFCRVVLGKAFFQFSAMKMAHAPPGHHSVIGRPSVGGLAFAEYVIYRGEQVGKRLFKK